MPSFVIYFLLIIVSGILGIFVGSFLNVIIDRLPRGEAFVRGRSHCDSCHHVLAWYDLLPLLSFIFLLGECRYCHKRIGWQAFVVEVVTGCLFALTFFLNPLFITNDMFSLFTAILTLLYSLYIISSFIIITVIDIKHGIIPNSIVYAALGIALLYHLLTPTLLLPFILSAFCAGVFFFFLFAVTRGRGMGFGDVKLALLLGLFLGFPGIIIALYIAFLTGAFVALILVIGRKKKFSGGTIPFGPFMVTGALSAYFYGNIVWQYLHIFSFF